MSTEIITQLTDKISVLETKVQRLEKALRKMKRDMIPESERKPRKPSGFAKPTYLSDTLCKFLNEPVGTEIPRTDVTRRVLQYVKDNDLQNPEARREIIVDSKLKELLNPMDNEVVTYFNIQRLLKHHYIKPETVDTPAPVTPVAPAPEKKTKPASARGSKAKKN